MFERISFVCFVSSIVCEVTATSHTAIYDAIIGGFKTRAINRNQHINGFLSFYLSTQTTEPIEEARKFLLPLEQHCSDQFETHYFAYQIAERRNKVLLMLRSILRCEKVVSDSTRPLLHECKVRFFNKGR